MSITPNMNLVLPTVSVTPGPEYATENNSAFEVVDAHDHTSGNGVQIPSAGINIDTDLSMNSQDLTNVRSVRFTNNQNALGAASDIGCAYEAGGNLYFNDASGTQIQLTAGGALNAASIGGIGGDYATSTASVYYTAIDSTYYFTSNTNTPATINMGSAVIREPSVSSNSVTVKSASSLVSSYNLTLPATLPASTSAVSLSATGTLATGVAGTVSATDLATNSVTTVKIADGAVTRAKQAAVGQQISVSSSGTYSTASATYVDITNMGVTITSSGRPIIVMVISDAVATANEGAYVGANNGGGAPIALFQITRNSVTPIAQYEVASSTAEFVASPASSIITLDPITAGTYTYKLQAKAVGGSTAYAYYCLLVAYEL